MAFKRDRFPEEAVIWNGMKERKGNNVAATRDNFSLPDESSCGEEARLSNDLTRLERDSNAFTPSFLTSTC